MGRYVAGGLAVRIRVRGRRGYDVIDNMNRILKAMSKVIDLGLYTVEESEEDFTLNLKEDIVNTHIEDFLKEAEFYCFDHNILKEAEKPLDYSKNKYQLKKENGSYAMYCNDIPKIEEWFLNWECFSYVYLAGTYEDMYEVLVEVSLIPLGKDYDKIAHEDESYLLFLLNRDVNRLKSPLKTAFIYGIIG